jgi:hypothetical protein
MIKDVDSKELLLGIELGWLSKYFMDEELVCRRFEIPASFRGSNVFPEVVMFEIR